MSTQDFIIELFCKVDDVMREVPKHPQASLHPSETVTLGLLFAIKGVGNRAFYSARSRGAYARPLRDLPVDQARRLVVVPTLAGAYAPLPALLYSSGLGRSLPGGPDGDGHSRFLRHRAGAPDP